jgi:hypothetical protein
VGAIFGQAAHEDFEHGTWQLIFTRNVQPAKYLLGRFLGAWLFACGLMLSIAAGQLLGTGVVALVEPKELTTFNLLAYLWPYVVQVWPMLLMCGATFFTLAALTRRMAPVYVGMVVLVLGYLVLSTALDDLQNKTLAAMLDPFGMAAFELTTRYWTPVERNSQLVGLTGVLLANRLLWSVVGLGLLALTAWRFKPTVEEQKGRRSEAEAAPEVPPPLPRVVPQASTGSWARTMFSTGWLAFTDVLRSPVYWSFQVAGLSFVLILIGVSKQIFGTATLPVTYQVLELARGGFRLFALITLTFYAGEIAWKERDARLADIVAATRVPSWVTFGAKFLALLLVAASLQAVVGLSALGWQLGKGYTGIEWRLYALDLTVNGVLRDVAICALALSLQVLIDHKYLGHFAMVLYYVSAMAFSGLGVEDKLVLFGAEPTLPYSDMNGYGQKLWGEALFRGYWWAWSALLLLVAGLFAVRGREDGWRARLHEARRRFVGPVRLAAAVAVLALLGAGGVIFYETHVHNPYLTAKDEERSQARYEQTYKRFATLPQPRITALDVNVDISPEELRLDAKGVYRVKNKTGEPITEVLVNLPDRLEPKALTLRGQPEATGDLTLGVHVFTLSPPLAPGEEADLAFELRFDSPGLSHAGAPKSIVGNGTFVNNGRFPEVGYLEQAELADDGDRKKYGLPPKERMRDRDDPVGLENNYIRQDSDFIAFKATVSTTADQLPVAPGTLIKEWTEGGRAYATYELDQPILNFVAFLSARYLRTFDHWRDVKLEIDSHPTHTANLGRMMKGMKDALAYCTENFGPYQHHQARIIEFPRYSQFAQSFPNTVPYSEAVGFIAQVREDDPEDLDYPYYVTAHEIAHQWWAHQVVGGNTQGATMTSETLAQYTALMVMKHTYGESKMRRFLKYELDKYLMGRAMERKKELPLGRVENQQYIHYQKGSLAMYTLQDLIGEDRVNRALQKYVAKVKFQGPPYTNATELISFLRGETPEAQRELIDDLFERIVVWDNRAVSATMTPGENGAWAVVLKVSSKKFRADQDGKQQEVASNETLPVGAIDEHGEALLVEHATIAQGDNEVRFTVPKKPAKVGIDPLFELVDRTPDDNLVEPTGG